MKFSELEAEFKPLATAEQIELGIKFLDKKEKFSASANFGIVFDDDRRKDILSQNCHANMSLPIADNVRINSRHLIVTENGSRRICKDDTLRDEIYGKYLRWLTKESCFAPYFIDVGDDFFRHAFIVSSDIPSPLLQNILLCTRFFVECTVKGFEVFNDLYDKYGGDVAFHIVQGSNLSSWGGYHAGYPYAERINHDKKDFQVYKRTWHTVSPLFNTLETWDNYRHRNPVHMENTQDQHYRKAPTVYGGQGYWGPTAGHDTFLEEFVNKNEDIKQELTKGRKDISVVKNPFARSSIAIGTPSYLWSEINEIILPAFKDKGYCDVA